MKHYHKSHSRRYKEQNNHSHSLSERLSIISSSLSLHHSIKAIQLKSPTLTYHQNIYTNTALSISPSLYFDSASAFSVRHGYCCSVSSQTVSPGSYAHYISHTHTYLSFLHLITLQYSSLVCPRLMEREDLENSRASATRRPAFPSEGEPPMTSSPSLPSRPLP